MAIANVATYRRNWEDDENIEPSEGKVILEIPQAVWDNLGPNARQILEEFLPRWVDKYLEANAHYGDASADGLGIAGQFSDLYRKIIPLKRYMWDGLDLTREPPVEILYDFIGHAFLTIGMIERQIPRKGVGLPGRGQER